MIFRWFFVLTASAALVLAADKRATPQRAKPAAKTQPQVTVPAGAEQLEANTWRYTDKAGKVWIYRKTPFGLVKMEEKDRKVAAPPDLPKATDHGETVTFEKKTPFGVSRWTKKKTELNDSEKKALNEARHSSATTEGK